MSGTLDKLIGGIVLVLALIVVFIGAGRGGKQTGGQQTAEVIKAGGSAVSQFAAVAAGGGV